MLENLIIVFVIFGCFAMFGLFALNIYRRFVKESILKNLVDDIHEMKVILIEFKTDVKGEVRIILQKLDKHGSEIEKLWSCYEVISENIRQIEIGCAYEHGNKKQPKATIISGNNNKVNAGNEGITVNENTQTDFSK